MYYIHLGELLHNPFQ